MKLLLNFIKSHRLLVIMAVYAVAYLSIFYWLEHREDVEYTMLHTGLDDVIPFCEYFIIPYLAWFAYVAISVVALCLWDKQEAARLCFILMIGMSVFLFVSWIFPNGQNLRPTSFDRDNVFVDQVKKLYDTDTSTNVLPSIHAFNSLAIMIACFRTKILKKLTILKILLIALGFCIICSTVFLKQHTIIDVITAVILYAIAFIPFYMEKEKENGKFITWAKKHQLAE